VIRYVSLPNPGGNLKHLEVQVIGAAQAADRADSREIADSFRRDLINLLRVTLRDVYLFELQELDSAELLRRTVPFPLNHVAELRRRVRLGVQTPPNRPAAGSRIHPLEGSSTLERVLDSLQAHPAACMVSMHLHPVLLTAREEEFFQAHQTSAPPPRFQSDPAMFYLGTERYPETMTDTAITLQRLLGGGPGTHPNLLGRLFVASDQPISQLFLNTVGNEFWGNDLYDVVSFDYGTADHDAVCQSIRSAWVTHEPGYDEKTPGLDRVGFLFDPYELSRLFRLPLTTYTGAVGKLSAVLSAPAAVLPDEGIEIGRGFHYGAQRPLVVRLADQERTKHTYVIGKTGTGKSTLLRRMIEQEVARGNGVCVIDPHGDLVESVLERIPPTREQDVVFLDPGATTHPFGLNLLEFNPMLLHHKDYVIQETIAIMRNLFYFEHTGPVFEHNLRHLVLTVMDESFKGNGTLLEVPRLLYDDGFRDAIVERLQDELAIDFWKQYKKLTTSSISDQLFWVVSKFDTFVADRMIRNIIGQARSTINFSSIMETRQILLVKLPSSIIGEVNAALLGMVILSKLRWSGMRRGSLQAGERQDYYIYVDEFQNFAASGFETMLAEARKFRLSLVLAHQHVGQLSAFNISTGRVEDRASQAVFGNVGTIIAFRTGVTDAKMLAEEFGPPADQEDLENLRNYRAIMKTIYDGEVYPPFTVETVLGSEATGAASAESIRRASIERYGRPREAVVAEIKQRLEKLKRGITDENEDEPGVSGEAAGG